MISGSRVPCHPSFVLQVGRPRHARIGKSSPVPVESEIKSIKSAKFILQPSTEMRLLLYLLCARDDDTAFAFLVASVTSTH